VPDFERRASLASLEPSGEADVSSPPVCLTYTLSRSR
jgi:hypothetical protein